MSAVNQQAKQTTLMCTVREIKIYELKVFSGTIQNERYKINFAFNAIVFISRK